MPFALNSDTECMDCKGEDYPKYFWCHKYCKWKERFEYGRVTKESN